MYTTTFSYYFNKYRLTVDNSILDKTLAYLRSNGCKAKPLCGDKIKTVISIDYMPPKLLEYHVKRFNPKPFVKREIGKPTEEEWAKFKSWHQPLMDAQTERDFNRLIGF